jgi:hypothetical protein
MMPVIYTIITIGFLMCLHELSHIVTAMFLNLKLKKVGVTLKPLPHVYVSVSEEGVSNMKRYIFLLSGNLFTFTLFIPLFIFTNLFQDYPAFYYGFAIQIILEINPYFSDYTKIAIYQRFQRYISEEIISNNLLKLSKTELTSIINRVRDKYMFSNIWYLHFFCWLVIIIILLSPALLISLI